MSRFIFILLGLTLDYAVVGLTFFGRTARSMGGMMVTHRHKAKHLTRSAVW